MTATEPDWYPDLGKAPGTFRWWTATAWTVWLSTDPDAAPPDEATILEQPLVPAPVVWLDSVPNKSPDNVAKAVKSARQGSAVS